MPGLPVLGSAADLRRRLLATQLRALHELGDVVRFTAGPPGVRLVVHGVYAPEGVHHVLAAEAARYRKDNRFYAALRDDLGDGLLTSQDGTWLRQRRFVQPLFTHAQVERYLPVMAAEAGALVERWRAPARTGEPVDLHRETTRLTLRVVGRVLLGADLDDAVPLVRTALPVIGEHVRRRGFAPLPVPAGWPTPANLRARHERRRVEALVDRLTAARRADAGDRGDLLGRLVAARDGGAGLSDAEVRDQVVVFLFAGHDTTATALTAALHLLGAHPAEQERAHEEARGLPDVPSRADLDRLDHLTAVLKEALRLYPPAYATSRRRSGGDDVVGGYRIPDGTDVAVYPWVTHRHPRHWDDPERFAPRRFAPEREAARHRYAWFPFGGGPRACIGGHFALLESLVVLGAVLRAYRVETPDRPIPVRPRVTLRPAAPVPCRLTPR
ncbi:cytochrome P450 [Geodermatophilus marinus]|nr:cytochrome P450 [Geodermatophilus sp. LHW52908]